MGVYDGYVIYDKTKSAAAGGFWLFAAFAAIYVMARMEAKGKYLNKLRDMELAAQKKRSFIATYFGPTITSPDDARNGDRWIRPSRTSDGKFELLIFQDGYWALKDGKNTYA